MQEVAFPYLNELNDVQRQAVTTLQGPVMVIAGPGSGKTRVLTYRIAHLLNNGVPPWQILALTFTNKAAKEMKERIERVVGGRASRIWAGTFHSLFARILRVEAHKIGYPNDFTIYDMDDAKSVINEILKVNNLDKKQYSPGTVLSRISSAKSSLITPKRYEQDEDLMAYDRMNRRPLIHMIYKKYTEKLQRSGAMDFDDLLLQMFKLLYQNPDGVREKYQNQFKYVLVDEFQDTNHLQYEIVKLLVTYHGSGENVCIVGDDAQSIYSFRGATIENILKFEHDFDQVQTFKLEQNYRSTQFIVEAANEVIARNKNQIQKKIWTDKVEGQKIKIVKAVSDNEEGKRVADLIIEQKNRHNLRNSEFAILYRTNSQSRVFEEHLRRYNIPYRIYGGLSFYQRKEVKDMVAYMRITVNEKDDEALKRIINYPRRGIGKTTIDQIITIANDNELSMWEVIKNMKFNARAAKTIGEFVKMINSFKAKNANANAYETATFIARKCGISELLRADTSPEGLGRVDNVNALLDGVKDFVDNDEVLEDQEVNDDKSLTTFLQSISLMTDADRDKDNTDTVTMMSVHAAKGLEFKSVFVVGLEENLFPSFMSLTTPDQIDEERRLFYVAITRAEQHLTLTYANNRYQYGQFRANDPSRFLEEISDGNLDSIVSIRKEEKTGFPQPRVIGDFKKLKPKKAALAMSPDDFNASPSDMIKEGMTVAHLKFGQGTVEKIDERRVATIRFDELGEKRIMLNYAKLMVLD